MTRRVDLFRDGRIMDESLHGLGDLLLAERPA
jgi:hypothetical protein